jgi:hypothetical protein
MIHDAGFLHLEPQIVSFAGPLAHARKHGNAAMFHGNVVDQLLNDDGLADAGAAEQSDFSAAQVRLDQVDYLDSRLKHLLPRGLVFKCGSRTVNG